MLKSTSPKSKNTRHLNLVAALVLLAVLVRVLALFVGTTLSVVLVEALGALFVLVDFAVLVGVMVLPGMALTGTKKECNRGEKQAQAFHVARYVASLHAKTSQNSPRKTQRAVGVS